ncbi:hypothetical protein J1TS5_49480 [Paenibacillus macerans]|uniref:hypothetical protein n=1 Tax=Paenibacillus macerans TaxID=44252 RepID=UPI001B2082D0|nr:hypothetical protein [Paenibacillus macerans]GIP12778.1 hypothetical protein J1TS5_49480 [Paenibacillus macerans]
MSIRTYSDQHAIVTEHYWYGITQYDVSNRRLLAQFDGNGGVSKYSVAGEWSILNENSWFTAWSVNGRRLPAKHRKTVRVLGRMMEIDFRSSAELDGVAVSAQQFCNDEDNAVYVRFTFRNEGNAAARLYLRHGMLWELKSHMAAMAAKNGTYRAMEIKEVWNEARTQWEAQLGDDYRIHLASSHKAEYIEQEGPRMILDFKDEIEPGATAVFTLTFSGGMQPLAAEVLAKGADSAQLAAESYRAWLRESFTASGQRTLNSLVAACLNVSHSMYKESGGRFAAFYAGVNYQSPSRTYFRDGYWTVLPLLPFKPEWVRNEIVTLAQGIGPDGSCPSAVIYNVLKEAYEQFWPDHYDSPSFFVMMLHDYLAWTHDAGLLSEQVNGRTVLELASLCLGKLEGITDEALPQMIKPDNRRDWCDNVVRQGIVAYDVLLYIRARRCYAEIMQFVETWPANGDDRKQWDAKTERLELGLRQYLWSDETGYLNYLNVGGEGLTENNVSIEQSLAPLFGIGAETDQRRVLDILTARLESRNNDEQPFGDWGVMTVFPQYSHAQHLVEKSAYPFRYHNGSDWPYLSGMYAWAKLRHRRDDWEYPLTRWFTYGLERGWLTPVEYYDPVYGKGSDLQGWSGMSAAAVLFGGLNLYPPLNGEMSPKLPPWGDCRVQGIKYRGKIYEYAAENGKITFRSTATISD